MNVVIEFFKSILEMSLLASAMMIIVLFIKAVTKDRINIRIVSFLWFIVVLRLCLPGMLESPVHIDGLFPDVVETIEQPVVFDNGTALDHNSINIDSSVESANNALTPFENEIAENDSTISELNEVSLGEKVIGFVESLNLWFVVTFIWIVGGAVVLLSAIKESVVFSLYIKRNSISIDNQAILDIVHEHKRTDRIHRNISISVCPSIQMPMTVGFFRPQILLPSNMVRELKREYIHSILLHELCHIRRNDILKNYICVLVKSLHWFNPLVWLSIKKIKEDMECACDQAVLKQMSKKEEIQYCESLLFTARFMQQSRIPQLVTSLCVNQSNLKVRIVKMIKPQKKSKSVVVISLVVAMMMFISCFTTACQPTPKENVIVGKNDDALDNIIEGTPAPTIDTETVQQNETWKDQLRETNVTVNIDTEIKFPQVAQLPVLEVGPKLYTVDDAWKAIQVFFQDSTVYDKPLFTKEVLEAQIITLQKELADIQSGAIDGDTESINDQIEYYAGLLQTAPSEDDESQAIRDLSFEEKNGREIISVSANIGNGGSPATLMIARDDTTYNSTIYFSNFPDTLSKTITTENNMEMTLDEAVSLAQSTMSDLGIEDMILVGSSIVGSTQEQAYQLNYIQSVNGIGIPFYQTHMMTQQEGEDSVYAPFLQPEQVTIYINGSGILEFVLLNGLEMGEVINENVKILSIDEVKDIFREQVFYNYYSDKDDPLTINIERIELGYFIQSVKDQQGVFRAIPVWDFLASEQAYEGDTYTYSVLTINAIDGSIVDRSVGY